MALIQAATYSSGTFLIAEGAWSIFLKEQAQSGYAKPATAGRLARMGIGAALIAHSLGYGLGDAA